MIFFGQVPTRGATPPADLISAWLIKTLGSVAMPAYSHLLHEESDQFAIMKAAGRSICAIARALQRAKSTVSRELRRNALPSARIPTKPAMHSNKNLATSSDLKPARVPI
jgi:Helix-turn-helix domain